MGSDRDRQRSIFSSAPVVESEFAAVLLLDVAGFVETTHRLARRGPNGAEEISNLLNRSFGPLTDIIREHGGDVIAFAGDGMLAMWNDTPRIDEAAHLAAQCGLALRDEMNRQAVSGQHQFRVRISAEVGEIHCCKFGGLDDRSCFVVVGSPIECLGDAYRRANVGDVVLCSELHRLIRIILRERFPTDYLYLTGCQTGKIPRSQRAEGLQTLQTAGACSRCRR